MAEFMNSLSPAQMSAQILDNECVAFKLFVEEVGKYGKSHPYYFVEGYDMPYYAPRVNTFSNTSGIFISCGGKKGVIAAFEFISAKPAYSTYKTLYFVDRDYDDNSSLSERIFVTDGYSVENYYASDTAIRTTFAGICRIDKEREAELDAVISLYQHWKSKFLDATSLFCGWYAKTKDRPDRQIKKDKDRQVKNTKYKATFPQKYATISSKGITKLEYSLEDLNSDYEIANPVTHAEINDAVKSIASIEDIRGKYVIQMVQEFIESVRLNSATTKTPISKEFSFEKNNNTILARLSFAADTTPRLRNYLLTNLH